VGLEEMEREADGPPVDPGVIDPRSCEVEAIGIPEGEEPGIQSIGRALDADQGERLGPGDP
jgi:hypothetical protein